MDAVRRFGPLIVVLLALVWAPAALAHANVVSTTPGDGAIVATAPADVRVLFDDPVTVGPGNAVVASDRTSVLAGKPRVERAGRELVLPLQTLANGDYSARWRIISDDGHLESGVLAFRVGPGGGAVPQSILRPAGSNPSILDVIARWLLLGGVLVSAGAALFVLLVSRAGAREATATVALGLIGVVLGGAWLLHATDDAATRFGHATQAAMLIAGVGAIAASLAHLTGRYLVPGTRPCARPAARADRRRTRVPSGRRPAGLRAGRRRARHGGGVLDRRAAPARAAPAARPGRQCAAALLAARARGRRADRSERRGPRGRGAELRIAAVVDGIRPRDPREDGALRGGDRSSPPPGAGACSPRPCVFCGRCRQSSRCSRCSSSPSAC